MALAPGVRLGNYEILSRLGAGAVGEVYRAKDRKLGRDVAIKVLPEEVASDPEHLRRFEREARSASALNHPNIVTIYEVGEANGIRYIAMECVEGRTLRAILAEGPLVGKEWLSVATQIAEGLAKAHAVAIVHRDLKPANIMVTSEGLVKILDFGLAKLTRPLSELTGDLATWSKTTEGALLGTVPYMSPEQARGLAMDHRSDQFSLGLVLYEMAAGRPAFSRPTAAQTLAAIIVDEPEPLSSVAPRLPGRSQAIVMRCLAKDPPERFGSTAELVRELKGLQERPGAAWTTAPARYIVLMSVLGLLAVASALAFRTGPLTGWLRGGLAPARIESIAVLPLTNLSGDSEQEYFADGMTEALISDLAKIRALRVISRTSAMRYKGAKKSLPEIARELNVAGIVEGSVQRSADRVRITAHLLEAAGERRIWNGSYERDLRDVLALQAEVARSIAGEVQVLVTPEDKARLTQRRQVDPRAYQVYLKGRFHWNKRTEDGLKKGLASFQQAIAIDPNYAAAYAGLADSYTMGNFWGVSPNRDAIEQARAAATRAVELDDTLSEAHLALALIAEQWDWSLANREYSRALELDPNNAIAHQWYGTALAAQGRDAEGIASVRRACELDPLSLIINAALGWALYFGRHYEESVAQYHKTLELDPDWGPGRQLLGQPLLQLQRYDEAIRELRKAVELTEGSRGALALLGYAYAASGRKAEAQHVRERLMTPTDSGDVPPYPLALVQVALGDKDGAFAALARAADERSYSLTVLKVEPLFDPLRSDPRFTDLLRRIGLEQ